MIIGPRGTVPDAALDPAGRGESAAGNDCETALGQNPAQDHDAGALMITAPRRCPGSAPALRPDGPPQERA